MTRLAITTFAVLAFTVVGAPAEERSTTFRDSMGREIGRVDRQGGTSTYYDAMGRQTGRAERRPDGTTIFYDAQGRQVGTAREPK